MSDPAGTYVDNGVQFGSQRLTINSIEYVAKQISIPRPTSKITRTNEYNVPNGRVYIKGVVEGTATLQLLQATDPAPPHYAQFTLVPIGGGSAQPFIVTDTTEKYEAAGETMVDISFSEKFAA